MTTRRDFLSQCGGALAFLLSGQWLTGYSVHFYSAAAQASGWFAWIEDKAGRLIGFLTTSGKFIPFSGS